MEQPTKTKLLTVAETFYIEGRGVVVMPFIPDYSGPMSLPVVLRRPSGEESVVQADLDIPRVSPPPQHYSFACCLRGVTKQDVPVGSEIWRHDDNAA